LISDGISPIDEPGLPELVRTVIDSGNLIVTDDGVEAVKNSNVMIIIAPTPMDEINRQINCSERNV